MSEIKKYTRNGHAWKRHDRHHTTTFFCVNRGCGKRVTKESIPRPGICAGGEIVPEMVSPRLTSP